MAITRTRASNNHIGDGIVILLLDLLTIIQQRISQRMQPSEVDPQICHLQHVLYVFRVGILNVHWWQHTVDNLTILRGFHTGVPVIAEHVRDVLADSGRVGECIPTVVRKVPVNVPRLTEIVRSLDQHSCRSERGKHDDQVGKVELRFQVQLDSDILFAILRLPPGLVQGAGLAFVDDLPDPVVLHRDLGRLGPGVAEETFLLLQMGHDAVSLGPINAARGRRIESVLAANQQVTRRRIATALLARMNTVDGPSC